MGKKANKGGETLNQKLKTVLKSGKYKLGKFYPSKIWHSKIGFKATKKSLRNGASKLLLIANNCPPIRKTELEYMAILGGSKVRSFEGNNVELGKYSLLFRTDTPYLIVWHDHFRIY